jgi:hypothetical protein
MASQGNTAAQLRDDIDSGRTGEKIDWPDPAAAPLGTDEEASGTPPHRRTVEAARRSESAAPVKSTENRGHAHAAWVQVAIVVILAAAAVGWIAAQL